MMNRMHRAFNLPKDLKSKGELGFEPKPAKLQSPSPLHYSTAKQNPNSLKARELESLCFIPDTEWTFNCIWT